MNTTKKVSIGAATMIFFGIFWKYGSQIGHYLVAGHRVPPNNTAYGGSRRKKHRNRKQNTFKKR